jgi:hypothetical protein
MLCFEVGDAFDAHAGGGGSKHASLDGFGLLGWLAKGGREAEGGGGQRERECDNIDSICSALRVAPAPNSIEPLSPLGYVTASDALSVHRLHCASSCSSSSSSGASVAASSGFKRRSFE